MVRRLTMAARTLGPALLLLAAGCGLNTAGEPGGETADVPGEGFEGDIELPDDARDRGDGDRADLTDGADGDADDGDADDGGADDGEAGPVCGDGIAEGIEQCDQGPANSDTVPGACRTNCRWFSCGDGVVDPGEACDDGNTVGGDGCEADCSPITCGNGRVEGDEQCDDGNGDNSDACIATCVWATCGDGFVWAEHEDCERTPRACTASCGSSGLQACVGCVWATDCTAPGESCNGLDDDCDTAPDNGFACIFGSTVDCATTCGSTGLGPCTADCAIPASAECVPPGEVCNGADDDCDTATDDGFECALGATGPCTTTCGSGGTRACNPGCTWGACTPSTESCNGADDDCDTATDEDFDCLAGATGSCSTTCGSTGTRTCDSTCAWGACTPPAELCNGADDDCDGVADETFTCSPPGALRPCTACAGSSGTQACTAECTWDACLPPAEICNGADDDCDTATDEGFACSPGDAGSCTASCGTSGWRTCDATCTWSACSPPAESCNAVDDDCDGSTDETFACVRGAPGTCPTACGSTGTRTCDSACAWGACTPPPESCNAADDDCDGSTDETFACVQGATRSCPTTCILPGTQTCSSACVWGACVPPPEVCNAVDDDCDTAIDETFDCIPGSSGTCTTSCGSTGTHTCGASCTWGTCSPPAETCNGRDDDCDTLTDDGLGVCNDTCAAAIDLGALGSVNGTTAGAADDNGRCTTSGCSSGGRDVWYRFTLAAREVVYVGLQDGETWNAVLDVRSGACGATTGAACANDACGNLRPSWAGTLNAGTYYVVVDACGADNGAFTLTYQHSPCPGALALAAPGVAIGNSCAGADTSGSCGGGSSRDLPYFFALCPGSHAVSADDCGDGEGWMASVYIRRGGGGTCGGTEVACGGPSGVCGFLDPRAGASGTVTGPGLVFVVQDGYSLIGADNCGNFDLDVAW